MEQHHFRQGQRGNTIHGAVMFKAIIIAIAALTATANAGNPAWLREAWARRFSSGWVPGPVGGAIYMNAAEYFSDDAAYSNLVNGATGITYHAWINQLVYQGAWQAYIASRTGDNNEYQALRTVNNGPNTVAFYLSVGSAAYFASAQMVTGDWHHVVATWASGGPMTIWVDGVESQRVGNISGAIDQQDVFRLGFDDFTAGTKPKCLLDDVAIFSGRALTSNEVAELYNAGAGKPIERLSTGTNGLVRYWKLDDGVSDSSASNALDNANGTYAVGTSVGTGDWTNGIVPRN